MTVLVTGGTGSVGLAVCEVLLRRGHRVVVHGSAAPPVDVGAVAPGADGDAVLELGDIRDAAHLDDVLARHRVDRVVHGAAVTPQGEAERVRAEQVLDVNVVGPATVVAAAARAGVDRVVHLGSVAAYGESAVTETLLVEDRTPDRPRDLYEVSKSAGERAARRLAALEGVELVALRLGDVFGRWEHATGDRQVLSAIHQVTAQVWRSEPVRLPRAGVKAWTYSSDVGEAVARLLEADAVPHDVVNLASPHRWSVADWCVRLAGVRHEAVWQVDESDPTVTFHGDNAPMSDERMTDLLGWSPEHRLGTAFEDYLEWLERAGSWSLGGGTP